MRAPLGAGIEESHEAGDSTSMLNQQDNATPGSAGGSIKSEPPVVKEEPADNSEHTGTDLDKKDQTNGDSKEHCKYHTQVLLLQKSLCMLY